MQCDVIRQKSKPWVLAGVLIVIGLTVEPANADSITLVCRDKYDASASVKIDTRRSTVLVSGVPAEDVHVAEGFISFKLGSYDHSIDRTTGVMLITKENGKLLSPFHCQRGQVLF